MSKRYLRILIGVGILIGSMIPKNVLGGNIFFTDHEYQAQYTAVVVNYEHQANCKVIRVHHRYMSSPGKWFYVKHEYQADTKIFWVDHIYQAKLKIFYVDQEYKVNCFI